MTIVAQFSWDDIASEDFRNHARKVWRETVAEIADKARTKLPGCSSRVYSAVKLGLAGRDSLYSWRLFMVETRIDPAYSGPILTTYETLLWSTGGQVRGQAG